MKLIANSFVFKPSKNCQIPHRSSEMLIIRILGDDILTVGLQEVVN